MTKNTSIDTSFGHGVLYPTPIRTFFFLILLIVQGLFYGYGKILDYRPQGLHAWRQSDCLSLTSHYQRSDIPFYEGRIHYLGKNQGRAISDFPLFYYTIGKIWAGIGRSEPLYRSVILMVFGLGLYCLWRSMIYLIQDQYLSAIIAALLFTSPMLAYYANNFLMNVPALSFIFISWFAFLKSASLKDRKLLALGIGAGTLAGLLKITASLSLISILLIYLGAPTRIFQRKFGKFDPPFRTFVIIGIMFGLILLAAWYTHAYHYNATAQGVFLVGVLPVWELTSAQITDVIKGIKEHFKRDYFRPIIYVISILSVVLTVFNFRKLPPFLKAFMVLCVCGVLFTLVLFFEPLRDHDYYSIDQLILFPLLLGTAAAVLVRSKIFVRFKIIIYCCLAILLIHCADFTRRRINDRYSGWMNQEYLDQLKPLGEMNDQLRKVGVSSNSLVICIPDRSFNQGLYLLDRSGWSDFDSLSFYPERMAEKIQMGAEYLIVCDTSALSRPGILTHQGNELPAYKNVRIFKLGH